MNRIQLGNSEQYPIYIKNNLTGKKIIIPVMPQNISESINANFTQQDIVGASRPRIVYDSTSAKIMNLSLQNLTEDYLAPGFSDLKHYVRAIQALAYPVYEAGVVKSPDITFCMGDRTMDCVCTNVSVTWGNTVKEEQITSCNIDLTLLMTRLNGDVPGATWIEENG